MVSMYNSEKLLIAAAQLNTAKKKSDPKGLLFFVYKSSAAEKP